MKKVFPIILLLLSLLLTESAVGVSAAPENSGKAMVLMHAQTGQLLFSKNCDEKLLIASTTKIMTALVVIENCSLEEKVDIIPEYTGVEGSSMYLAAGESYTVEQLLYGLMLSSGNDAALALAQHCAGSVESFVAMMNEKAQQLGLLSTGFKNPNGLDAKGHGSTARELALLTAEAMKNPVFTRIVSAKSYTIGERCFKNHNRLLWSCNGVIGVKTGYTRAAGRTLVSCAERHGLKLICVTLNDPDDWRDHSAYYDWAFENYEYKNLIPWGTQYAIPVISGQEDRVYAACPDFAASLIEKGAAIAYTVELPHFVYAGVTKGETAGTIYVMADGKPIGEYKLVYTSSVPQAEDSTLSPWRRFRKAIFLSNNYGYVFDKGR